MTTTTTKESALCNGQYPTPRFVDSSVIIHSNIQVAKTLLHNQMMTPAHGICDALRREGAELRNMLLPVV